MAASDPSEMSFLLWLWAFVLRFIFLPPESDTSSPPRTPFSLLQLPESVREEIYLLLEYSREGDSGEKRVVMVNYPDDSPSRPESIGEWSSKHRRLNTSPNESIRHGQGQFANQLFYVSRGISQDARSFFYSHNKFRFYGMGSPGIPHLSALTKVALQSLRDIQVQLSTVVPRKGRVAPHVPFYAPRRENWLFMENKHVIMDWKDTCFRLAHAPPFQLSLFLVSGTATVKAAKAILGPLLKVQLKECSIRLGAARNNDLQRYIEYIVSWTTKNHRSEKRPIFHKFGELPVELQMKVLQHTDLVPSSEIISQGLQWDTFRKAFFPRGCMARYWFPPGPFDVTCKAKEVAYSSSNRCWEPPSALLQTSKSMNEQSQVIFYQTHNFSIDIHIDRPPLMLPSLTEFIRHDLGFLEPFPQNCIRYLRSLQWNFPRGMDSEDFRPHSSDTVDLIEAVMSLREHACLWKLTLILGFRIRGDAGNILAFLDQHKLLKRVVETIGPQLLDLKDFFIHIKCSHLNADLQRMMEQELERVVKGEDYNSDERGKPQHVDF